MHDPVFWSIAVAAVFIVARSKAGLLGSLGLVGVPLLSLVMSPRDAAGTMLPVLLVMDCIAMWTYRKEIDWRILRIMLPGAILGTGIGWALSAQISDAMVLLGVGILTVLFCLDAMFPIRKVVQGLPPSKAWGSIWGGIAGFTSFVSHTGGPPFQIFVLPQRLTPAVYSGTTSWFFGVVNAIKLIPYFFLGQLSVANLSVSAALAPVGLVGVLFGVYLVRRISDALFYRIAYVMIFVLSLKLIWDGAWGVFGPATVA